MKMKSKAEIVEESKSASTSSVNEHDDTTPCGEGSGGDITSMMSSNHTTTPLVSTGSDDSSSSQKPKYRTRSSLNVSYGQSHNHGQSHSQRQLQLGQSLLKSSTHSAHSSTGIPLGYSSDHTRRSNAPLAPENTPTDAFLTPLSAITSKKRLSSKLADRFSKFEGNTSSTHSQSHAQSQPQPPFFPISIDEVEAELDLSPLHMSSQHRHDSVPLSATARKRTIGTSLVGRVKVFDSPKKQSATILLSPTEVKQLVRTTATNRRIKSIKSHFEQRKELKAKVSAKEAQRKLLLQINKETRQKKWKATKAQFTEPVPMHCQHHGGGGGMEMVPTDVRAASLDLENFVPPNHGIKTPEQRDLILDAITRYFVFSAFRLNGKARTDHSVEALIQAFEVVQVDMGQVLWYASEATATQTEADSQAFHIVENGSIAFHANGVCAGTAMSRDCFGLQSLLYATPPTVTVSVALDSSHQGQKRAQLLKLHPNTFRGLVYIYSKQAEDEKLRALKSVDFLKDLLVFPTQQEEGSSLDLLRRLASVMTRIEFKKGDSFEAPEDTTFFILNSGQMKVQNTNGTLNTDLHPGNYFGERALIGSLPRRSLVCTKTTMTATSESGVLFRISRTQMEQILGQNRLQNLKDLHRLANVALVKRAQLSHEARANLVNTMEDYNLKPNTIFQVEKQDKPALYVVRTGTVTVSCAGKSQKYKVGDIFGHEQLEETTNAKGTTIVRRISGLQVTAVVGHEASIAILPIEEQTEKDNSQHLSSPISNESNQSLEKEKLQVANTYLDRRKQIRKYVQDGMSLEDFEKIRLLGEGEFGEVWLVAADILKTGEVKQKFALKSQRKIDETRGKEAILSIQQEIDAMRKIDHPQIVHLIQTYEDDQNLHMLMGLIPGGDLWDRIYQDQGKGDWKSGMPEEHAKFYTMVIADTLGHIHARQIIFRDLKPENIMIDAEGYPVVVDFGFAKYCPDKTYTFCGTPNYVAPEIITNAGHNQCVDYWALGITLYEMITGENPFFFDGMEQVTLYDAICQENYYPLSTNDDLSSSLLNLIDQLLEKEPTKRLGMLAGGVDDLLNHPWFDGMNLIRLRAKRWPAPWKPLLTEDERAESLMECAGLPDIPLSSLLDSSHSFQASFASHTEDFSDDNDAQRSFTLDDVGSLSSRSKNNPTATDGNNDSQSSFFEDVPLAKDTKRKTANKQKKKKRPTADHKYSPSGTEWESGLVRKTKLEVQAAKEKSKSRRSTISATLAGLGIDSDDEYKLF